MNLLKKLKIKKINEKLKGEQKLYNMSGKRKIKCS